MPRRRVQRRLDTATARIEERFSILEDLMTKSFADLMAETRRSIKEVSLEDLKRRIEQREDFHLVDVREGEEYRAGFIPGATSVPRGFLESKIEQIVPDK